MDLPELPSPPDPGHLLQRLGMSRSWGKGPDGSMVPWPEVLHLAATRGRWDDPTPLLWVDALLELSAAEAGSTMASAEGGAEVAADIGSGGLRTRLIRCLSYLAGLGELSLETKWLRQTPREDSSFVYTGSLYDVLGSAGLEETALLFSRLLRTVGSYDYSRELIRDAAAWDPADTNGLGLRLGHAAGRSAAWHDEDPGGRERARALLLRWLGYIHTRKTALPPRPPRGDADRFPIEATLTAIAIAVAEEAPVGRRADAGSTGSGRASSANIAGLSCLTTLGRVQDDTRVMMRSLREAWSGRWSSQFPADPADPTFFPGTALRTESLLFPAGFAEDLRAADLSWVRRFVSPEVARVWATITEGEA